MDSTKASKPGRKTNNSQSAGMTKGTSNTTTSGTTNTPRGREATLETNTQNIFTPGMPDMPEGIEIPETSSFLTAQEEDQRTPVPVTVEPEYPDIEDLTELGSPFAPEDLPDRGSYKEVFVEFPACMPFSSFGESVSDTGFDRSERIFALARRHRRALQLGEAALRRPVYSSYNKVVSRKGRKDLFKEEMDILKELLSNLYYFNSGTNQVGFALQKIILVNLNHRLKLRRNEAEEDLIVNGEGIPQLPRWGINGKADEFWSANDFEILGACYCQEVENFLAYLAEHHDFVKTKGSVKSDQQIIVSATPRKKSVINTPIITTVCERQPAFIADEPDSISIHLRKSKTRLNLPVANMNTSVFGHPVQNNSSHALRELFGVGGPKQAGEPVIPQNSVNRLKGTNFELGSGHESQGEDNGSNCSRSHRSEDSAQHTRPRRQGGGDPGDSDGDDSDKGGGDKGPRRGARKPFPSNQPRKNPFDVPLDEVSSTVGKVPPEPQFDTKLKVDAIPTWDGNPENLRRWLLKINGLAKRSQTIFRQLGALVPT